MDHLQDWSYNEFFWSVSKQQNVDVVDEANSFLIFSFVVLSFKILKNKLKMPSVLEMSKSLSESKLMASCIEGVWRRMGSPLPANQNKP